jgi:MinD-like ATPase involved in chromosome partitioning or flagellar assembly
VIDVDLEFVTWLVNKYHTFTTHVLTQMQQRQEASVQVAAIQVALDLLELECHEIQRVSSIIRAINASIATSTQDLQLPIPQLISQIATAVLESNLCNDHVANEFVQCMFNKYDDVRYYTMRAMLYDH